MLLDAREPTSEHNLQLPSGLEWPLNCELKDYPREFEWKGLFQYIESRIKSNSNMNASEKSREVYTFSVIIHQIPYKVSITQNVIDIEDLCTIHRDGQFKISDNFPAVIDQMLPPLAVFAQFLNSLSS